MVPKVNNTIVFNELSPNLINELININNQEIFTLLVSVSME